ncbi:DNA repair protein rhp54 [Hordeum vulgare]|nr:DNA repair protein rhp54 [Hordeum vulgare]
MLVNVVVVAASTDLSAFPRMVLPEWPRAWMTHLIPGFHVYPQAFRLSGECSLEVSVVVPSTPTSAPIGLNATLLAGGSSYGGPRKRARVMPADMLPYDRNLFDRMPAVVDDDMANRFMQNIIFEGDTTATGGAVIARYDPEETQS